MKEYKLKWKLNYFSFKITLNESHTDALKCSLKFAIQAIARFHQSSVLLAKALSLGLKMFGKEYDKCCANAFS